jgi:histidine triad (HIT) family protein
VSLRTDPGCLFCRIVAGDVPATIVAESEHTVAFRDIHPQADVHVLVVPRVHEPDVGSLAAAEPDVAIALLAEARRIADDEADGQYRLVFNTGERAGQTVFHAHAHVLGGAIHAPLPG